MAEEEGKRVSHRRCKQACKPIRIDLDSETAISPYFNRAPKRFGRTKQPCCPPHPRGRGWVAAPWARAPPTTPAPARGRAWWGKARGRRGGGLWRHSAHASPPRAGHTRAPHCPRGARRGDVHRCTATSPHQTPRLVVVTSTGDHHHHPRSAARALSPPTGRTARPRGSGAPPPPTPHPPATPPPPLPSASAAASAGAAPPRPSRCPPLCHSTHPHPHLPSRHPSRAPSRTPLPSIPPSL